MLVTLLLMLLFTDHVIFSMFRMLFIGSYNYESYGGYGGGSYMADSAVDKARQVSDNEGDGYVIIKRLHTESGGVFS